VTIKPVIEKIKQKIDRSKVNYAVTLVKSLSSKDEISLNKIWALCGFKSKFEFEQSFKKVQGISFKEYVDKLY
jgi:YesN/AraC family two-component response regulator